MFNLELAICDWRRQLSRAGVRKSQLSELESHLREHVREQIGHGLTAEQAFAAATNRLGEPKALAREFSRAAGPGRPLQIVMLTLAAVVVAFVLFLGGAATFLCYNNPVDRVMIATAVLATVAVAFSWRLLLPLLPAIPELGKRVFAICIMVASAFAIATLYCQVIVLRSFAPVDGQMPAIGFFCMVPVALGFSSVVAFEEAARREFAE